MHILPNNACRLCMTGSYKHFLAFSFKFFWKLFFKAGHFVPQIWLECIDSPLPLLRTLKSNKILNWFFGRILLFLGKFLIKLFELFLYFLELFLEFIICAKTFPFPFDHDLFCIQSFFINISTVVNSIFIVSDSRDFLNFSKLTHIVMDFLFSGVFRKFHNFHYIVWNHFISASNCRNLFLAFPCPKNIKCEKTKTWKKCWYCIH